MWYALKSSSFQNSRGAFSFKQLLFSPLSAIIPEARKHRGSRHPFTVSRWHLHKLHRTVSHVLGGGGGGTNPVSVVETQLLLTWDIPCHCSSESQRKHQESQWILGSSRHAAECFQMATEMAVKEECSNERSENWELEETGQSLLPFSSNFAPTMERSQHGICNLVCSTRKKKSAIPPGELWFEFPLYICFLYPSCTCIPPCCGTGFQREVIIFSVFSTHYQSNYYHFSLKRVSLLPVTATLRSGFCWKPSIFITRIALFMLQITDLVFGKWPCLGGNPFT